MMYRWMICVCLLLGFGTVDAHQPDLSSTILAKQGESTWVLQVRAALTAFEWEVHYQYGEGSYATPEEFEELVIKHLQENISIQFDKGTEVVLKNGAVKLGHETNAFFEVKGIPEHFDVVKFTNSCFKDISRNQSALIIAKEGITPKQFTLNNANQHTAHLKIKDVQFVSLNPETTTKKAMAMPSFYFGIVLLGILGVFVFFKYRTPNKEF